MYYIAYKTLGIVHSSFPEPHKIPIQVAASGSRLSKRKSFESGIMTHPYKQEEYKTRLVESCPSIRILSNN